MEQPDTIDISESEIRERYPEVLAALLRDHTRAAKAQAGGCGADCRNCDKTCCNIAWATDDYSHLGPGFRRHDPITPDSITGANGKVVRPRVIKTREEQEVRTKGRAEVFTPAWVCNMQNNLVDEAWFGRPGAFNTVSADGREWTPTPGPVAFTQGRTWLQYVRDTRLEMACGEAPYTASLYDTTTGLPIPLHKRIGTIDRKLRIVSENTSDSAQWLKAAQEAFKHTYAFEWQGDSLLLAREALLYSFKEHYRAKFGNEPARRSMATIAYIISWNVWQMDGLTGTIPGTCHHTTPETPQDIFSGPVETKPIPCPGCATGDMRRHNGTYCLVKDWDAKEKKRRKPRFIDLLKTAKP